MPARLTDYERITIALAEAQAKRCGAWWRECANPRQAGDHLCVGCRTAIDKRWKGLREGTC